jgi:hypothetical protein
MHTFSLGNSDFPKAIKELAQEVGISPMEDGKVKKIVKNVKVDKQEELAEARARAKYIDKVDRLYKSSQPLKGTLGEKYLRETRGIKGEFPTDFRFKPRCWHDEIKTYRAALIVPGYDKNDQLQSVNRIYLDNEGKKINDYFTDDKGQKNKATDKRTYGPTGRATVKINEQPGSKITLVTEGTENALSVKQAQPDVNIVSAFGVGQLKNLTIEPATKTIVLCADNDDLTPNANSKGSMLNALQKWLEQGYQVKIALPFGNKLGDKIDFNDLLKQRGIDGVKDCLKDAIEIKSIKELGDKTTPLSQDFMKLKDEKQQIKTEQNMEKINHQKVINIENDRDFER